MTKRFTRQELYDLVWSEPMRLLAKKYEISDRGLAKACQRANIPVPERGYWNKLQAGKKAFKCPLPARGLGMSDEMTIGGTAWANRSVSNEEALAMVIPPPPVFGEPIENVAAKVKQMVAKIRIPKTMANPQRLVARLLDEDEVRRKKNEGQTYDWNGPIFDTVFERRRLKILNSLFTAVEQCGAKPSISGKEARGLTITVGDTPVYFKLDGIKAARLLEREQYGYGFTARDPKDDMILEINSGDGRSWKDTKTDKVEDRLTEIVEELLYAGEVGYRKHAQRHHQWLMERKASAEQEVRKREEEKERQRLEQIRKLEQQQIDHLLAQANALRQATEIRTYVESARRINATLENPASGAEFEEWASWALAQADRIDPVKAGKFRERPSEIEKTTPDKKPPIESHTSDEPENWFRLMNSWPRKQA